mmetsp:Transcript_17652/g.38168  ORF Transcript_17652/g.38168 Transcript_17652/m.38168 type:complete len:428 (+) Transcript_17652:109-1392(+)|eukprot:CAMPEP_0172298184 /NCGR_PEP_ID=MMETSP1058-20130122/951_1 /TAXON_ID=83371 /ORGANISM="Detonula confervacea, Strain CCMP 353" /LENGTH=427 /DNA_ID=CAMNT_0013007439 /DNA_START=68 /DNA_END=1351 /DNA_ORIENTATION=+
MKEDLYDQIILTLLQSELTYAIGLMRELGRKGQLEGDSNTAALKLPINAAEFKRIINANPKLASVFDGHNEDAALQFSAVDMLKEKRSLHDAKSIAILKEDMGECISILNAGTTEEKLGEETETANDPRKALGRVGSVAMQGSELVFFSDQADKGYREQTEMVYGIGVDKIERRVMVIFRGSRTPADWAANKDFHGISRPNPVKGLAEFANESSLPNEVYIHKGFDEYLHRADGTDEGIFEILMPILQKHNGYSLWVSGHSLGGGLASLFAVSAACRDDIPKPVNCITHAQPLVGDVRLFQSVRKLEESKHLLLLRTRNCEDGVPAVPAFSAKPSFTYTHIGMELKMYDDDRSKNIKLSKSEKKAKNFFLNFKAMMILFIIKAGKDRQKRAHSLREHLRRLELYEEKVRTLGSNLEDVCSNSSTMKM